MKNTLIMIAGVLMSFEAFSLEIQGHRGARAVLPENTLPAFEYALRVGVDTLELDLNVTRDNELVVMHDPYLNPKICLHGDGKPITQKIFVRSLSLKELKTFDCGTLKNPRFPKQEPVPGTRIPTLKEVFSLVKQSKLPGAKTVQFNIETKIVPGMPELFPSPKGYAALVVKEVREAGFEKRSVIQSFDHRMLREVKKIAPTLRLAALVAYSLPDLVAVTEGASASILSPNLNWITREEVERLQQKKIRVIPWTANEPSEWKRLIEMGVDGIITDDPQALMQWLKKS